MSQNHVYKLAEMIKSARTQQKLTQEQLAAATGVGVRFIRELENGKQSCHIGKALAVVSMLGIVIEMNGVKI